MRGGYGTGDRATLAERAAGPSTVAPADLRRSPARHCLVGGEPSLLVEWRRGRGGWEGRVLSVVWLDGTGWVTLERWLPAAEIAPVPGAQ